MSRGQLEISGGAWVMSDEATPYYWATIENFIVGQRYVSDFLGVIPNTSWSVDPFGHGLGIPLLYKGLGIEHSVIGRVHKHIKSWMRSHQHLVFHWRQPWG